MLRGDKDNAFNLPGAQILLTGVPSGGVLFVSLPSQRPENHVAKCLSDDVSSTQRDRFIGAESCEHDQVTGETWA
ncbi:hypothetical protein [Synechococcus sp. CBW1107]|uniref:hypothetical protein n=1 Tax=Synechococcus sp. CBW1107 TaxID=2789857 RepID=UPI002AD4AD3C|nr:hypothetical protein [Synechococcus sp. CBW1107]